MPEFIASFIKPNEPVIERLFKKTASILRDNGKPNEINGYDRRSKRVWELSSATWSAVNTMGLDYSLTPANFEKTGQKICSPEQISDAGITTSLDLTVFFCSALEECNLNPIIIFIKEHVFS